MSFTPDQLKQLRAASPYYPLTKSGKMEARNGGESHHIFSTITRIERGGKWYAVLCISAAPESSSNPQEIALKQMMSTVHGMQYTYIAKDEDLDTIQDTEHDRLAKFSEFI